jgi:hypothetical protein
MAVVFLLGQFAQKLRLSPPLGRNGFLIDHLGLARAGGQAVFTANALQDDLQMQFAHAREDDLIGLLVVLQGQVGSS